MRQKINFYIKSILPPLFFILSDKIKRRKTVKISEKMLNSKIQLLNQFLSRDDNLNSESFESFLPKLGINEITPYPYSIFPLKLKVDINKGLRIWQYPNQFAEYLFKAKDLKIERYLEIGLEYGGSFIVATEFLRKFNLNIISLGIDIKISEVLKIYKRTRTNVMLFEKNSNDREFKSFLEKQNNFDLVFIDGDHSRFQVERDFELIINHCKHIAFHDIVDYNCPGVREFWTLLKGKYKDNYLFFEFINQYPEILESTGQKFLGIGLMVKIENY